ncbi:MAG: PQQ-binding-like beta-propeller repeat protein [Candidatus Bathyarchaeia archaeon]
MKLQKTRKLAAASLILTFATAMMLAAMPAAQALDIPTFAWINISPNPVGLGQTVYVNAFMSKPTPTAGMAGSGDQYENIRVNIIRPDGRNDTIGPLRSDSTGGTWATYAPTQIGNYTFQMVYPGGVLMGGGTVFMGGGFNWTGSVLLPSMSVPVTLSVQQEQVQAKYRTPPLPTEYWSRPIYATNYDWGQLAGSWFGMAAPAFATTGQYDATGNFNPYSPAPKTGHVIWTKPTQFGGQPGAPISSDQMSQYSSSSIAINHFEPIILNGVIYYTKYASITSAIVGWEAVDLRTGQTLWSRNAGETGNEVMRMAQILRFHTVQEYGSVAYIWSTELAGFFQTPTFFSLYDAWTGKWVANITTGIQNVPFLADWTAEQEGTLLAYYTNATHLILWNSTKCFTSAPSPFGPIVVTIRPSGTFTWSSGIQWAVPIPTTIGSAVISPALSVAARTPEVILLRAYASPGMFQEMGYGYQTTAGFDAKTGSLLWGPLNQSTPYLQDVALLTARDGVYVLHNKDTDEAYGYSLRTGQPMWGPVKLPGNAWSTIARAAQIAYGMVYIWDFGGYVNALDLQTGQIKWTFTRGSAGYDTPFGVYTLWHFGTHSVADGMLFFSEGHMYDPPMFPGAQRLAINATTGKLVWSLLSFSGRCPGAIADGFLVEWNSYDSQIYTIGKGQTATTVSIKSDIITRGDSVLVTGRVTDESPGTKDPDRVARFPNGVPAVADESMSPWMEYVYMQQVKPTNAKGVTVTLTSYDPNGNFQNIGTTTTDPYGNYAIEWTPPVEGTYYVEARFDGSESYWPSADSTYFAVVLAPKASAAPAAPQAAPAVAPATQAAPQTTAAPLLPVQPSPSLPPSPEHAPQTEMYVIAGVVVAIIVAAAVAAILLRRRK